jgi:toxin ParE1/3/4
VRRLPIVRSDLAKDDLGDIWLSIAIHNPDSATRVVQRIDARIRLLAEFPELGPERPEIAAGMRMLVQGNYLVLYRITESFVEIVRVVHGARDLDNLL